MGESGEANNKEDLARQLRELLGLDDIKFEKLSKEELTALIKRLSNMAQLVQIGVQGLRGKVQEKVMNRPLKQVLSDESLFGKNGIFGLGILGEKGFGLGIIPAIRNLGGGGEKAGETTE